MPSELPLILLFAHPSQKMTACIWLVVLFCFLYFIFYLICIMQELNGQEERKGKGDLLSFLFFWFCGMPFGDLVFMVLVFLQ